MKILRLRPKHAFYQQFDHFLDGINQLLPALSEKGKQAITSDELRRYIRQSHVHYLLCCDDEGGIVGQTIVFFALHPKACSAEINEVVTLPGRRRQGTGGMLVKRAIEIARHVAARNQTSLVLQLTSKPVRKTDNFYRDLGFKRVGHAGKDKDDTNLYKMWISDAGEIIPH